MTTSVRVTVACVRPHSAARTTFSVQDLGDEEHLSTGKAADRGVIAIPVFPQGKIVLVEKSHFLILGVLAAGLASFILCSTDFTWHKSRTCVLH